MLHFAMHAEALLLPFIMDVEDPIWLCMKLHLRIIRAMSQHAITRDAVDDLAKTIYKWQKLFLSISEYDDLFKPKAHFYSHYPMDILNFGPTRQYWCMRFEAFNQFFKRVATGGNFQGTLYRLAFFWMVRSGLMMKDLTQTMWTPFTVTEEGDLHTTSRAPAYSHLHH